MTGRVWRLSPGVSFRSRTVFVVPVAGSHELPSLLEVAAVPGHMVAVIAYSAVGAAIHEGGA